MAQDKCVEYMSGMSEGLASYGVLGSNQLFEDQFRYAGHSCPIQHHQDLPLSVTSQRVYEGILHHHIVFHS